jgi:hypothetical protein
MTVSQNILLNLCNRIDPVWHHARQQKRQDKLLINKYKQSAFMLLADVSVNKLTARGQGKLSGNRDPREMKF